MARIRSIKPELFMDDGLADVSIPARFLLAGLPCLADREGRLEDRPRRIQAQIFPYDAGVDVGALLSELARSGHIIRYVVDGERYVQVCDWEQDQRPHIKEAESAIPSPLDSTEHQPSTVKTVSAPGTRPEHADTNPLGSGILGVGSEIRDQGSGDLPPPAGASAVPAVQNESEPAPTPADTDTPKPEALQELWNRLAPPKGLQRWSAMGKQRRETAKLRLRAEPRLEAWEAFLKAKLAEPFFLGENDRRWKADVGWLLRAERPAQVTDHADSPSLPLASPAPVVPIRRLVEM